MFVDLIDGSCHFDKIPLAKAGILGYNPVVIHQESNPKRRFARGTHEP
jgi:hypothetical protein